MRRILAVALAGLTTASLPDVVGPLQAWPQEEDGALKSCSRVTVLEDELLALGARCEGMVKTSDANVLECRESCRSDPLCAVWRFSLASQCWQGTSVKCEGSKDKDLLVIGAERLQHGDVAILRDLTGWRVSGLRTWAGSAEACRAWCYSNVKCRYWLHDDSGCWVEESQLLAAPGLPLVAKDLSRDFKTTSGEYIQHLCAALAKRAVIQMFSMEEKMEMEDAPTDWKWDCALFSVVAFILGRAFYSIKRDPQEKDALDGMSPSSTTDMDSDGRTLDLVRAFWWQLPLAPMLAWFQPGQLEHIIHGPFATRAERRAVAAVAPKTPAMLANFLAWRRVTISALFSFGVIHYAMQYRILCSTWRHHLYFDAIGASPSLAFYETWAASHPESNFLEYSKQKMLAFLAGIVAEALRGAFVVELIVCVVEFSPLVMLALALLNWTSFTRSRRHVVRAWLVAFITPFAISLFPARLMLSFDRTERQIDNYVHELAVSLHLDKVQQIVLDSCGDFDDDLASIGDNLRRTCSTLAHLPPHLTLPCIDSMALCHADLDTVVGQCKIALRQVETGHVEQATGILKQQCKNLEAAFMEGGGGRRGRSQAFQVLLDMMKAPIHFLMPEVESVGMTVSALHAIFMVLPPVVATVPGILCAALATKVLLPHSGVPGVIMILVPVILASAAFLVCTILFQYVSDPWLLAFLMVCLIGLLAVLVAGAVHNFAQPSPRKVVRQGIDSLVNVAHGALFLMVLLGLGILHDLHSRMTQVLMPTLLTSLAAWCDVSWARLALACAMHTLYSFMLTTFAVTDKLISDISAQQHYWTFFVHEEADAEFALEALAFEAEASPTTPSWSVKARRSTRQKTPWRHDLADSVLEMGGSPMGVSPLASSSLVPDPWAFSQAVLDQDLCEMLKHRLVAERWEQHHCCSV